MTSQPQTNGPTEGGKYIDNIDPEDPEYIRQMRRPAEVKEDVVEMMNRLRVTKILNSQQFRDELEELINEQMKSGPNPSALLALQQISELVLPQAKGSVGGVLGKVTASIIPISDIRGTDQMTYAKGEKILRCRLAACYRLVDLFGWSSGFKSVITFRINQEQEHFLTMPHGLMFHEVTASSLVKCDMQGEVVDPGSTTLGMDKEGFQLHSAIQGFRPDVKCIIHIRAPSAVAVSAMECGLLPMSHEAIVCGEPSYYDYTGTIADEEERDKIARALGPSNKVMVLRNYGFLVGGESIEEAFHLVFNLMIACESQLRALPLGLDNIHLPSEEVRRRAFEAANQPPTHEEGKKRWRRGELEYEGLMRHLDNCGYRTGHLYREPNLKRTDRRDRANDEVEIPPTTSSFAYMFDDKTPVKQVYDRQKKVFKCEWLNTPNAYKREDFEETGTPNPKTITKWVPEDSANTSSNPIKVETANQFAPLGPNAKELKDKYKEIRKEYYTEKITAGPQSKILEGITWDEAQRIKEGQTSGTSDPVIVVGAASKGIIQRDHQHNAVVYKTYYAPNPFDNMSEEEITKYKKDVENKARGGSGDAAEEGALEPGPDGHLISTEERMEIVRQSQSESPEPVRTEVVESAYQPQGVRETNIDDVAVPVMAIGASATLPAQRSSSSKEPPSPQGGADFQRSHSARLTPEKSQKLVKELEGNFGRSKSERKPSKSKKDKKGTVNGEQQALASPTKSTSSGEGYESKEGSPVKEAHAEQSSPSKEKKKKKGFRMPSFSKKKEKKEK